MVGQTLLREAGMASRICKDFDELQNALGDDTSFVIVTEEALRAADPRVMVSWIGNQPAWSDLPFIILTQRGGSGNGGEPIRAGARFFELFGNVTLLERPFHPATFISVARTALKGRQRQYEARARIEELHEGEERLRTAMMAGRLGSWELDLADWTLVSASATCKALFGRGPDEAFAYEDLIASIHPDDKESMLAAMRNSAATGADYTVDCRNIWPDGSIRWAEMRARPVRNRAGGGPPRLVGVSSDVTDRKAAEENLKRLNEILEQHVAARTAELQRAHDTVLAEIQHRERAEEQLRQVQKMEMIGQLTGGVAHDFNNLLMAVIGNLELLRKHIPSDPKSARLIASALQGAERGATLTQRLLAFARRQDLQVEPKNLADLVRGMSELLERSVGSRIELHVDLPETAPLALVDANQIELALLNLVVNARDAMPDGGVLSIKVDRAEVQTRTELPPGSYVRLTVSDTGHGMDADTLRRAAEPFFSTKELGKGTGLGLSMVHGLAVQLNGSLRLMSEPGRGTTAQLWLPVTTRNAAPQEQAAPVLSDASATSPRTILVVDDDPLIAMSTVDMLEDLGHEVIGASSGAQALDILRDGGKIDLLITDFSMPVMTGLQLAKAVRKLRPKLPILLATGYAELPPDSEINLPRLGKPYLQEQLAAEIAKLLHAVGP
jgi:PAS domain S-box-containing protein